MLARCPSCGGQVREEAEVCESCGWDFVTRQRRPGSTPKPPSKPPAEPPKAKPPKPPEIPPAAGKGLLQFPKIDKDQLKKGAPSAPGQTPFALPQFGKEETLKGSPAGEKPEPAPKEAPSSKEEAAPQPE